MPKRKHCDRAAEARQKQLYLIFDDWSGGYTIRHVNLRGLANYFAYAFGASIIAALPQHPLSDNAMPIFDVRKRSFISDLCKRSFISGLRGLSHLPPRW